MKCSKAAMLAVVACAIHVQARPAAAQTPDPGRELFIKYCALCHGEKGDGNGRMRSVIAPPPPADLRTSVLSDEAKTRIILRGGAAVGRSPAMPSWGDQLTEPSVRDLVGYLRTLAAAAP